MHNESFYNSTYTNGDRGGNLIKIYLMNGEQSELHAYLDSGAFLLGDDKILTRPFDEK